MTTAPPRRPVDPSTADHAAIALMVTSGLAVAVNAGFFLFLIAFGTAAYMRAGDLVDPAVYEAGYRSGFVIQCFANVSQILLSLILGAVVFAGARNIKRRKTWGFALCSSIIAVLPCWGCCLFTMPFGIWAIVVLANEDVKATFIS